MSDEEMWRNERMEGTGEKNDHGEERNKLSMKCDEIHKHYLNTHAHAPCLFDSLC